MLKICVVRQRRYSTNNRFAWLSAYLDRVVERRGEIQWFSELNPRTSALVIVDMQNTFCLPDVPGEVPTAREIVPTINDLAAQVRDLGVP